MNKKYIYIYVYNHDNATHMGVVGGNPVIAFIIRTFIFHYVRGRHIRQVLNPFMPTVRTFAVRETASLGIMGAPRVPP